MRPPQAPRAIIFDLDDTIVDDSRYIEVCWEAVCEEGARWIRGISTQTLRSAIDRQRDVYWADTERHRKGRLDLRAATRRIVGLALEELKVGDSGEARAIADIEPCVRSE